MHGLWLQVEYCAMFIRPWFWTTDQSVKTIAGVVSHNVKLDGMMLWQIASMQARRYDLFVRRALDSNLVMA